MKIWEILKEENVGKSVKCSTGKKFDIDKNCNHKIGIFSNGISIDLDSTEIMTLDFEFIQQPVTFEEVLNSDKKCRLEHEILNKKIEKTNGLSNESTNYFLIEFKNGKYLNFNNLLEIFIWIFPNWEIKQIFKEAKWYLEP